MDFKECLNRLESRQRGAMTDKRLLRYLPGEWPAEWVTIPVCPSTFLKFQLDFSETGARSHESKHGGAAAIWSGGKLNTKQKHSLQKIFSVWAGKPAASAFQSTMCETVRTSRSALRHHKHSDAAGTQKPKFFCFSEELKSLSLIAGRRRDSFTNVLFFCLSLLFSLSVYPQYVFFTSIRSVVKFPRAHSFFSPIKRS